MNGALTRTALTLGVFLMLSAISTGQAGQKRERLAFAVQLASQDRGIAVPPVFEVASVKPSQPGQAGTEVGRRPGGRLVAVNATAVRLLRYAYMVQDYQLVALPAWAANERFDIAAKMAGEPPRLPGPDDPFLVFLMLTAIRTGQAGQTRERLAFDVASVRENRAGGDQGMLLPQGSQLNAQNYRLRPLIQFAYRVQPFELVGGPDWIDSARFDIVAKATFEPKRAPAGAPPGEMEQMVQTLLAERFKLQVHRETREMPIYALVLARRDGQMGPRLRREADVCAASRNATARGEKPPDIPPRADGRPACGMMGGGGRYFAGGVTLAMLASALSAQAARVVVDRTGLSGYFEADIEFSSDALTNAASERPSLFTALEEQLGLRLEPARAAVEVLVIDRVERPTEN